MSDVRLTATNPADSSVVPVACNDKGELLVDIDSNISGDLTVSGKLLVGTSTASSVRNKAVELHSAGTSINQPSFEVYSYPGANATNAGYFEFYKSRGATVGANTIVANGDTLGYLRWYGANGTGYDRAVEIIAQVDGTPGASNDMPGRLVFSTNPGSPATGPTERMVIKSNGTINFSDIQVFADNSSATSAGLVTGDVYRKSDGTLMIAF